VILQSYDCSHITESECSGDSDMNVSTLSGSQQASAVMMKNIKVRGSK
jgi:hypothetical protein